MRQYVQPTCRTFVFAITLTVGLFAQDFTTATSLNAKDFLGTWQGSFHGKVFITLSLLGDPHKLSGSVSGADVELNDTGELTKAEANEGTNLITSAKVNGKRLHIVAKSSDGSENSIDAEIVLVGPNEAELRMIVPPDVPRPKAWPLKRVPHS
jgi:hypothetical protein